MAPLGWQTATRIKVERKTPTFRSLGPHRWFPMVRKLPSPVAIVLSRSPTADATTQSTRVKLYPVAGRHDQPRQDHPPLQALQLPENTTSGSFFPELLLRRPCRPTCRPRELPNTTISAFLSNFLLCHPTYLPSMPPWEAPATKPTQHPLPRFTALLLILPPMLHSRPASPKASQHQPVQYLCPRVALCLPSHRPYCPTCRPPCFPAPNAQTLFSQGTNPPPRKHDNRSLPCPTRQPSNIPTQTTPEPLLPGCCFPPPQQRPLIKALSRPIS